MDRRIQLQFEDAYVTIRPEQCSVENIKLAFGVDRNVNIVLKKVGTEEVEFATTDGKFQNVEGSYSVIVHAESMENRSQTLRVSTNDRFGTFEASRVPTRRNIRRSWNPGSGNEQEVDIGNQRRTSRTIANIRRSVQGNVDGIRRTVETEPVGPTQPVTDRKITVYFKLGKVNSTGVIVPAIIDGVSEIPVTLGMDEAQDIDKLTDKITSNINSIQELRSFHADRFQVFRPNSMSRMLNSEEMKKDGISFWATFKRTGRKCWILKAGSFDNEKGAEDADDDDFAANSKSSKRQLGNDGVIIESYKKLKTVVKTSNVELSNLITQFMDEVKNNVGMAGDVKVLKKKVIEKEKDLNDLVTSIKGILQCKYCLGVSNKPKICKECNVIVGCEECVQLEGQSEKISNGDIYKYAGTWECPQQCGNFDIVNGDLGTIKLRLDTSFMGKWEEGVLDDLNPNHFAMLRVNSKRIKMELQAHNKLSPEEKSQIGVSFEVKGDKLTEMDGVIIGPPNTPYVDGRFKLSMTIPETYPFCAPSIKYETPVWHPNIRSFEGEICFEALKEKWNSTITIQNLLIMVREMMASPNPRSPLEVIIGDQMDNQPQQYYETAKFWTQTYASGPGDKDAKMLEKIDQMVHMGFDKDKALRSLSIGNWNVQEAVSIATGTNE